MLKRDVIYLLLLFALIIVSVLIWPEEDGTAAHYTDYGWSLDSPAQDPYGLLD